MFRPKPQSKQQASPAIEPLIAHYFYRKHGPTARHVIGLGPTMIDKKIRTGELPAPIQLFEGGKALGWYGQTLIELMQSRIAKAVDMMPPQAPSGANPHLGAHAGQC